MQIACRKCVVHCLSRRTTHRWPQQNYSMTDAHGAPRTGKAVLFWSATVQVCSWRYNDLVAKHKKAAAENTLERQTQQELGMVKATGWMGCVAAAGERCGMTDEGSLRKDEDTARARADCCLGRTASWFVAAF